MENVVVLKVFVMFFAVIFDSFCFSSDSAELFMEKNFTV